MRFVRAAVVVAVCLLGALHLAAAPGGFVYTGSLTTARMAHTATMLQNGLVLIAGGGTVATVSSAGGVV
jgi:hypothetical protein